LAVLGTFGALFVLRNKNELRDSFPLVLQAHPQWVALAVGTQFIMLALTAAKYRVLMTQVDARVHPAILARAHLRRHFVSTTIPLGGPAGLLSFIRDMAAQSVCATKAIAVSIRASLANEVAFILFLLLALTRLAFASEVSRTMTLVFGATFVIAIAALIVVMMVLRSDRLPSIAQRLPARVLNGMEEIRGHGFAVSDIAVGVPFALATHFAGVGMLTCAVYASGHHPGLTTILAARLVASLATVLLPVFQGAGVMEVTLVGMLHAGGVPVADALAATVIFRVAQFWVPLALGALMMARWQPVIRTAWNGGPTRLSQAAAACLVVVPIGLALLEFDILF
jgi:uncharacterized membrane protein YbhN (UPF0104 family)